MNSVSKPSAASAGSSASQACRSSRRWIQVASGAREDCSSMRVPGNAGHARVHCPDIGLCLRFRLRTITGRPGTPNMPSKETVRRQRSLGGAVGVVVLGLALVYHFFPRVFHVEPSNTPAHRAMNLGPATAAAPAASQRLPEPSELDAGPPLTLAPTDVVVARLSKKNTNLPDQLSADTPEVEALIARADKALKAGQLAGDQNSAAALYEQALKDKPDSRRAAQGLFDVRERLVAEIGQDLAVGDAESA